MSTFEIPTGPPMTQGSLAYNTSREEARRAKRRMTTLTRGSLAYDREKWGHTFEWPNEEGFRIWLASEESEKTIELVVSQIKRADSEAWRERRVLRCSREFTGGKKTYQKKNQWDRMIPSKKTGCRCCLTIKLYPGTDTILGKYEGEHDHPLGEDNLRFTRLSGKVRNLVMDMVYIGIDSKRILKRVHESCKRTDRDYYITMRDINRYRRIVEDLEIRLDDNDAISLQLWLLRLQQGGDQCVLKDIVDPPPPNSGLSEDSFVMCIQTKLQRDRFLALGMNFVSIDATHNTTQYAGLQLFTLLVRDLWGHGVPVAWMLTSSGMEATITYFLNFVKERSPEISPAMIMTDCDKAQMNAISAVYPSSMVLLCWWHVLRAIRSHFRTEAFPALWQRIRTWVKTSDQTQFDSVWQEMQTDPSVPQSLVDYLQVNWMGIVPLWSGIHRKNRTIFQESDTNMLLEAYHHVLKTMWLDRKHNRRADHLVYTLVVEMVPYYENRHRRQELGFHGPNLAQKRLKEIHARTPEVKADSVHAQGDDRFYVRSEKEPSRTYQVNLGEQSCDCPDWPRVRLCKHVAAVAHFFGNVELLPTDFVSAPAPPPATVHPDVTPLGSSPARSDTAAAAILENVISVSKDFLSDGAPSSPGTVRSLHMVEAHLSAVVRSARSSESPLPDKEHIPPNQNSWTETAKRMGVDRRKRRRAAAAASSPEPPATQRIGELNRKQPRLQHPDPYGGGVSSGRNAAPDARSAAQNAQARASAAAEPALSQPRRRGRKRAETAAPPVPPPPASGSLQPHGWYAAQPTALNAGAYPFVTLAPGPSLSVGAQVGNSFAPPLPSSTHLARYPVPAAYPSGIYPYPAAYWPYGQFYPSQPYRPQ